MFGKSISICRASSNNSSALDWSSDCWTISPVVFTRFQKCSTDPSNACGQTNSGGWIKFESDMLHFTNPKMSRRSPSPRRRRGTRSSVSIPAPPWGIAGRAKLEGRRKGWYGVSGKNITEYQHKNQKCGNTNAFSREEWEWLWHSHVWIGIRLSRSIAVPQRSIVWHELAPIADLRIFYQISMFQKRNDPSWPVVMIHPRDCVNQLNLKHQALLLERWRQSFENGPGRNIFGERFKLHSKL